MIYESICIYNVYTIQYLCPTTSTTEQKTGVPKALIPSTVWLDQCTEKSKRLQKHYESIGFGATDVSKPYEFRGCGTMDVTKPYESIWFLGGSGGRPSRSSLTWLTD